MSRRATFSFFCDLSHRLIVVVDLVLGLALRVSKLLTDCFSEKFGIISSRFRLWNLLIVEGHHEQALV